MLCMGMLGELDLRIVLQRAEACVKTGLLLVKQGEERVELYLQQGRLLCVGPVKAETTLWDRLLQAGVISAQARQEAMLTVGAELPSDFRMAFTLISLGHVSHERLRAWVATEAVRAIQLSSTWTTGEMYFDDGQGPPTDRYLVDLPIGSLLVGTAIRAGANPAPTPSQGAEASVVSVGTAIRAGANPTPTPSQGAEVLVASVTTTPASSNGQMLMRGAELLPDMSSIPEIVAMLPQGVEAPDSGPLASGASMPSELRRVSRPLTPVPIDTSFMRPEMVLVLRDFSLLREQNPQIQLTPEQWYLFARADGHTSLQSICQMVGVYSSQVCLVAGELMALGLVNVVMPMSVAENGGSPSSVSTGLSTGPLVSGSPFNMQSQGDTGEREMTFVNGYGWVHRSQLLQVLESSGSLDAITDGLGQRGNGGYPI